MNFASKFFLFLCPTALSKYSGLLPQVAHLEPIYCRINHIHSGLLIDFFFLQQNIFMHIFQGDTTHNYLVFTKRISYQKYLLLFYAIQTHDNSSCPVNRPLTLK